MCALENWVGRGGANVSTVTPRRQEDSLNHSQHLLFSTSAVAAVALVVVACSEPASPPVGHSHIHSAASAQRGLSPTALAQVAALRNLTASFHNFTVAEHAGWKTRITECFSDPSLGGMGFHYGNTALIDGRVDPLEPELLLYEPRKNGELRFVAVEYIVPFTAWTAASPPELFGQQFHRNEDFGLWVLHVWHFNDNPSGMFSDWNPNVSCAFAAH